MNTCLSHETLALPMDEVPMYFVWQNSQITDFLKYLLLTYLIFQHMLFLIFWTLCQVKHLYSERIIKCIIYILVVNSQHLFATWWRMLNLSARSVCGFWKTAVQNANYLAQALVSHLTVKMYWVLLFRNQCTNLQNVSPPLCLSAPFFPISVSVTQPPLSHLLLSLMTMLYVLPVYVCVSPCLSFCFPFSLSFFSPPLCLLLSFEIFKLLFCYWKIFKHVVLLCLHAISCTLRNLHLIQSSYWTF